MGKFVKGQPKPPGSGRKKGQRSKHLVAMDQAMRTIGPFDGDSVEFMKMVYKHADLPLGVRMQAANSILNFERPRLSQVEVTTRSLSSMSDEEFFKAWDKLEAFLERYGSGLMEEAARTSWGDGRRFVSLMRLWPAGRDDAAAY